jgi:AraC family transcriptional regulator of adaptative response / DNA-3-methyladenine glycosylase II
VKTTGVFCRPICPAIPPKERNVEYFPSAAAAAKAGFRACLRCRPECAPGTPGWKGAPTTVARALRLITDGGLENANVDRLAERLGIGARHLRRLFGEHLGASPAAVDRTRRLLSAKRLIDETDMTLTAVALSAGFRSVRRFNAAFLESYGRSPRELRRLRPAGASTPLNCRSASRFPRYSFQLRYRPPFDWDAFVGFLGPRAIPGIESVEAGAYRRTIELGGRTGWLQVQPGRANALQLVIEFPEPAPILRIVARVRRMFDLDADPMLIDAHLAQDDLLEPLVTRRPGLRVPLAWDGFELGVRAILGQQVNVSAATTLAGRLVAASGRPVPQTGSGLSHTFPSPHELARSGVAGIGLPRNRGEAVRLFASAVASGRISFDAGVDVDLFREHMLGIAGIGKWTAEYVALRGLGDPDAFPSTDLGLLRASGMKTARELIRRAQTWRPWRAYAALHLWTESAQLRSKLQEGDTHGGSR